MEPRRDTLSTYDLYYPFQNIKHKQPKLPPKGPRRSCEKKLLVFDINGVLADVTPDIHRTLKAPKYIDKKAGQHFLTQFMFKGVFKFPS